MPPVSAAFQYRQCSCLLVLALLVGNTTAGLAGRLARGLALTAAAVLGAVAQILGFDGLDTLHNFTFCISIVYFITVPYRGKTVNYAF
jgi:hypothetical protein